MGLGANLQVKTTATEQSKEKQPEADDVAEREAILSAGPDARMLVEAGPGTGKTQLSALRLVTCPGNLPPN